MAGPVASFAGVSRRFGQVTAVDDLSLVIERGQIVALLGPNGAGKTTSIEMLLGLIKPDSGVVGLCGGRSADAVADGRVGAMLQDAGLPQGARVGELIRVIGGLYRDPLSLGEVLQLCDLEDLAKREVQRLSGGERQRVRLALALAGDPEFVVLDEPTATLDVAARNAFWQRAQAAVSEGRTVLYATHRLEEADAVADRVVVIAAGRVMADGTPDEVKAQSAARHTVRFSAGHVEAGTLEHLPGVQEVESRQDRWTLYTTDADQTIRALLQQIPHASEMEVTRAGLEDVFLSLIQESGSS